MPDVAYNFIAIEQWKDLEYGPNNYTFANYLSVCNNINFSFRYYFWAGKLIYLCLCYIYDRVYNIDNLT